MELNKPEQDLKRDLQGIASDLKWSAVELKRIAERLSQSGHEADAQAVLKMCTVLHTGEDRLAGYADEVRTQHISRSKPYKVRGMVRRGTARAGLGVLSNQGNGMNLKKYT